MTPSQFELAPQAWGLLLVAAVLVGVSKTALPGINTISIAIFAAVLPAKASTGALLLLLIVGDVFALVSYRREADWRALLRLIPFAALGLGLGALFLALTNDGSVRRVIGAILLVLIGVTLWQRWHPRAAEPHPAEPSHAAARAGFGTLGGFTTMVANAGGPVMSLYFLSARLPVATFLGTAAWFFAAINLTKLPISISLGLITPATLELDLLLVPGVVAGAFLGRLIAARIRQRTFEWAVIAGTSLGALYLLLS
ncbi:sulfite exporter TauE/SafE family protein [Leucobacter aridicollis]|uniref:sulfite exporter TauE/SafE family protein n=1 Tax=Leucobacter aridicollis TaxID=283878 RepID=UPI0021043097|nr:sulfite exporter TauE/SafE family protein [Leucobacter aridicollis]UTX53157.1 sulfite exporter TauE/SafE family protein [Leucobacter aridicollis]